MSLAANSGTSDHDDNARAYLVNGKGGAHVSFLILYFLNLFEDALLRVIALSRSNLRPERVRPGRRLAARV